MKYPVVECEDLGGGCWRFWCEHCRKHHVHSAGAGHRVAHCGPNSPYRVDGYILRLSRRPTKRGRV